MKLSDPLSKSTKKFEVLFSLQYLDESVLEPKSAAFIN